MLSLAPSLADKLDFEGAVRQESVWTPDLLPQPLDMLFAGDNVTVTADVVAELGRAALRISPADVIAANKWRYGRRPVAVLPLAERILYRAVVNHIRDDLPVIDVAMESTTSLSSHRWQARVPSGSSLQISPTSTARSQP